MHNLSISKYAIKHLKDSKNLLAFSGGIDSTALFFTLRDYNILFDIAIIDYGVREQSKDEVKYAIKLCDKYNKQYHVLQTEKIDSNFESNARNIRYSFFNSLIIKYNYKNLITAHHFDDKLEWFFMQLANGAGLNTLLGFREISQRILNNKQYFIIRPFINHTKKEILKYNDINKIHYFIDESNKDTKYLRNFFRENITKLMSEKFANGLKKSFKFLQQEYEILYKEVIVCIDYNLFYFKTHVNEIHTIDLLSKQLGYIISTKQRQEILDILKKGSECVMGGKIVISKNANLTFIGFHINYILKCYMNKAKFQDNVIFPAKKDFIKHIDILQINNNMQYTLKIPKQQRDIYRKQSIPKKIRPLLYINSLQIWDN